MRRRPARCAGCLLLVLAGRTASAQCVAGSSPGLDFRPGDRVLFASDFSANQPGDFPAGVELKTGAVEVSLWEGKPALKASSPSVLLIPLAETLPERFTLELAMVNRNTKQVGAHTLKVYGGRIPLSDFATGSTRVGVGTVFWEVTGGGVNAEAPMPEGTSDQCVGQLMNIRLTVDGSQLKLYADDRRLASVANAQFLRARGIMLALEGRDPDDNAVYLTSIRLAAGGSAAAAVAANPPASAPVASTPPSPAPAPASSTVTTATTGTVTPRTEPVAKASGAVTGSSTPLTAPAGVTAAYVGSGRFAIAWSPVPGASEYEVYVNTAACRDCRVSIPPVTDTTYVPQNTFDYQGAISVYVRALNGSGGVSPNSTPVSVTTPRHWGAYRVTVQSVRVNRETLDDPAQIDGKRDEIIVSTTVQRYDSDGNPLDQPSWAETKVHGDVNAAAWSTATSPQVRIKAGTASALGGLRTGDVISPSGAPTANAFPLLVWEGILREDGITVAIVPVVWEVDRTPSWQYQPLGNPGMALLTSVGAIATRRIRPIVTNGAAMTASALDKLRQVAGPYFANSPAWAVQAALNKGYLASIPLISRYNIPPDTLQALAAERAEAFRSLFQVLGAVPLPTPIGSAAVDLASSLTQFYNTWAPTLMLLLNHNDRPIGVTASGGQTRFVPRLLKLDFESVEGLLASGALNSGGPGVIEVRYKDEVTGGNGDYSIMLKIERMN